MFFKEILQFPLQFKGFVLAADYRNLRAAASAADLSGLAISSKSGHIDSFSGQLAGPAAGLADLAGSTGSANLAGPAWE